MKMSSGANIAQLASEIQTSVNKVWDHVHETNLPEPSFDLGGPTHVKYASPDVEAARVAAVEKSMELTDLLMGPADHLRQSRNQLSLHAIYNFRIASCFPPEAEISYEDLSQACGIDVPILRSLLRYAMVYHRLFKEPRRGVVAHTAASKLLADETLFNDWLGLQCEETWPSASRTVAAMRKWPHSQEPNHSGFALANNTECSMYQELHKYPERSRRFARTMETMASSPAFAVDHLLNNWPWQELGRAKVVDLGGSDGFISSRLAENFPDLQCVVQDMPEVIAKAKIAESVAQRVTLEPHNFLEEQPHEADVYLFRWILHNWPDKYCIKILRNLIPKLRKGARIIINDAVLPEPHTMPSFQERQIRAVDLVMLSEFNARERELPDWKMLFEEADHRFRFKDVVYPKNSALAILEAVWEG